MATDTAAAYRRVKILKPVTYAREELVPGALVFVDAETAARWERDGLATPGTNEPAEIWTTCPKCVRSWWIPAEPPASARWVACMCGHGWMR